MKTNDDKIEIDGQGHCVRVNGRPLNLQDKATRVLSLLVRRAPELVSRSEIIDSIWSGNYLIGDRGLNQALWSIRSELGDDARDPVYIKTVPREGYRWIGASAKALRQRRLLTAMSVAASACVIAIAVSITTEAPPATDAREYSLPSQCTIEDKSDVQAYQVNRDVFVDIENGCRLIAKPEGTKIFGNPVVSDDGKHVAFTVTEADSCRLVSVALQNGERAEFDHC